MTIPGTGTGIGATGASQPTVHEKETVANAVVARSAMAIVKDTLTIALIIVDDAARKYQSSSNRPVLAPLSTTRGAASYDTPTDQSWKQVYQELTTLLPASFKQLFESSMQLPKDQRNPNITILDGTLQMASKLVQTIRNAAIPTDPESLEAQRALDNIAQPYIALNALALSSEQMLTGVTAYLTLVGANNPNFDKIASSLGAFTTIARDLKEATVLLSDTATEAEGKTLLDSLHDQIALLSNQFDRTGSSGEFLLLGNTLHSAQLATAALLLENSGASALVYGLANSTYHVEKDKTTDLGVTGTSYSAANSAIADGIKKAFLPNTNAGNELIFKTLFDTAMISTLLLGNLSYDTNAAKDNQKTETPNEISERNFSHELTINFLADSGMLSTIGNLIAKESGASESQQAPMAALLEASLMLMLITPSIKGGDLASAGPLLSGITDKFHASLAASGLNGDSAALSQSFKVTLLQAEIAMENNDNDALLSALEKALELTEATKDSFINDLHDLNTTAHTTSDNLNIGSTSTATTGLSQVA